jgi:hypothetical protein
MGHRMHPIELIQTQGAADFEFLVSQESFTGPELTPDGISYRRADLEVEVFFSDYCGRDRCVATRLAVYAPDTERPRRGIDLEDAYVARGLGPPQAVPGSAQTLHAAKKSLGSQAQALRLLIAFLKQQNSQRSQESCDRAFSWFQS